MVVIQENGDAQSRVFSPRGPFILGLRAVAGNIAGDWYLYYTDDPTLPDDQWQEAHDNAFSDTYYNDEFRNGSGLYFRLRGGTGTNIVAWFTEIVTQTIHATSESKRIVES